MPAMYSRVFVQILDSSLADNFQTRHVFEDFLKLCNRDGVVDMTRQAIARRINAPLEIVTAAIAELEAKDPQSRDPEHHGRRLIRLDDHRAWGWRILNWHKYEAIRFGNDMREWNAAKMRNYRAKKEAPLTPKKEEVQPLPHPYPQGVPHNEPTCSTTCSTTVGDERETEKVKTIIPSETDVRTWALKSGIKEAVAVEVFRACKVDGWADKDGLTIGNWRSYFRRIINNSRPVTGSKCPMTPQNIKALIEAKENAITAMRVKRDHGTKLTSKETAEWKRLAEEIAECNRTLAKQNP